MSLSAFLTTVEKDVEIAAKDVLKVFGVAQTDIAKVVAAEPKVLAALGVVAAAVSVVVNDAATSASNPASFVVSIPSDIADIKAVWPTVTSFLATLGITVK